MAKALSADYKKYLHLITDLWYIHGLSRLPGLNPVSEIYMQALSKKPF
jgi:hypothetical protein